MSGPPGASSTAEPTGWRSLFPPAQWLRAYEARWLGRDLIAGVTLAAYAIPVSLAYAGLAGLPPQVGLYGYLLGGLGYALFGSSRQPAVGPTSANSLMVGATVAQMAGGDAGRYAQIATLAGFVVALMSVLSVRAWSKGARRHVTCSEPRAWQPKWAMSTASRPLPTLWRSSRRGADAADLPSRIL